MIDKIIKGALVLAQLGEQQGGGVPGWPKGRVLDAAGAETVELDAAGLDAGAEAVAERILAGAGLDAGARDGGLLDRLGDRLAINKAGRKGAQLSREQAEFLIAQEGVRRANERLKKRGIGGGALALPASVDSPATAAQVAAAVEDAELLRDASGNLSTQGIPFRIFGSVSIPNGVNGVIERVGLYPTFPFDASYLQIDAPNGGAGLLIEEFEINGDDYGSGELASAFHPLVETKQWLSGERGQFLRLNPARHQVSFRLRNTNAEPVTVSVSIRGKQYRTR